MTWTAGARPGWPQPVPMPVVPPPVTRKFGLRGALFSLLVTVSIVVGAGVMGVVLVASGRPDAVAVGVFLASLPVGPLIACYLWLDRYEPEPVRLLVLSFFWGALVATGGALLVQSADQWLNASSEEWSAVVIAPVTEEAGKGLFILLLLWARRHVIDGVVDGLVYAGLIGVGFAFTENILYFAGAYTGGPDFGPGGIGPATGLFVLRGMFSPFAHPLFTSAIGVGVGVAVASRRRSVRLGAPVLGYVVAVGLHAAWNGSAFLEGGAYFVLTYAVAMVPGFLGFVALAVWARYREGVRLAGALTDLARLGYLDPQEVPWLVRPAARRAARRDVESRGGPAAARAMRDYQQQAVELAALHTRVLGGRPPAHHAERGTQMVHRLAALRVHLMWLQAPTTWMGRTWA